MFIFYLSKSYVKTFHLFVCFVLYLLFFVLTDIKLSTDFWIHEDEFVLI